MTIEWEAPDGSRLTSAQPVRSTDDAAKTIGNAFMVGGFRVNNRIVNHDGQHALLTFVPVSRVALVCVWPETPDEVPT